MRRCLALLLLLCCCAAGAFAQGVDPNVDASKEDQIRELMIEAVEEYRVGNFDEAALRLENALALDPENRLVYEFYLSMGDVLLLRMQERAELEDIMRDVLRRARVYQKTLRKDPKYINLLIDKLGESEKVRLAATLELVAIGPVAVPQLVARLKDNRQDNYRVWARAVLTRMGYRAVIPLTEALNASDERVVQSVAVILADIGDPRALPKLQQLVQADGGETVKRVLANSIAAVAARSQMVDIAEPQMLYFQEAMRYFRDGDQVRDELVANESLVWRWHEDPPEGSPNLQYVRVPRYAWNELVAEELVLDGMRHWPGYAAYQPLLAADLAAQDVEATLRHRLAEQRIAPPQHPDATLDALAARVQALDEMQDRVLMAGSAHLYRAVQQSIVSERYDVALYLMQLLEDDKLADSETKLPGKTEGLMADKPGTVLVAALEHPEKRVRYGAAITLAHLDPLLRFFNAERVVPLLGEAVGEWGMLAVMVVEPDYRHRNTARSQLMQQGLLAFTANDGFQARQLIDETPVEDAIFIAGDLTPALRDEHGVVIDVPEQTPLGLVHVFREDPRTADTPIFIVLPENKQLSHKIRTQFEQELGDQLQGFVQRPYNGVEMKGQVELALGDAELPELNREERERISLRACEALGAIDPVKSQFPLADASEALVGTIQNRADPIRKAALRALGHTGDASKINRVTETYQTQIEQLEAKPDVRAAFLYCIGLLDPSTEAAIAILADALQAEGEENRQVRRAAHEAVGHGTVSNEILSRFQHQQRLDVRAPGAGEAE